MGKKYTSRRFLMVHVRYSFCSEYCIAWLAGQKEEHVISYFLRNFIWENYTLFDITRVML